LSGDLSGLKGTVVTVNGETFNLTPSAESAAALGISEDLEVSVVDVVKVFDVGAHVKVIKGAFTGETGMVLKVDLPDAADSTAVIATLMLDSSQRDVRVFVRDIVVSAEIVASVASIEGCAWFSRARALLLTASVCVCRASTDPPPPSLPGTPCTTSSSWAASRTLRRRWASSSASSARANSA
jgi:hypothetical protein